MDIDEINKVITQHNGLKFMSAINLNDHDLTKIEVKKIYLRE